MLPKRETAAPRPARAAALGAVLALAAGWTVPTSADTACEPASPIEACEVWTARYNSATPAADDIEADFGNAVGVSPDGSRVFVAGRIRGLENPNDFDLGTVAYGASTGAELWAARHAGGDYYDFAQAIAVAPGGGTVFVAGSTHTGPGFDMLVVAHDAATGAERWATSIDGVGFDDLATDLDVSDDGGTVVVTGESAKSGDGTYLEGLDMLTTAIDAASGEVRWSARHDAGGTDRAGAVDIGPDTRTEPEDPGPIVVVAGSSASPGASAALATVGYDLETGEPRWSSHLEAPWTHEGRDVEVSRDGATVVVLGNRAGPGGDLWNYVTAAYRAEDGGERWHRVFAGESGSLDQASALALAPDGSRAFVTGVTWTTMPVGPLFVNEASFATLAYDVADGREAWRSIYDGGYGSDDVGTSIAVTPDGGRVFVSGHSRIPGVWTYATVALRPDDGSREWVARLGGADGIDAEGPKLAVAPGRVYVTGSGMGASWYDMLTVAYEA